MSKVNGLLSIARASCGEAEAIIFQELLRCGLVPFWPAASVTPMPQLEDARALIDQKVQSFGYLVHHDLRVWFIRGDESYDVFVNCLLSNDLIQTFNTLCMNDLFVKWCPGWTHLRLTTNNELQLLTNALRIWSSSVYEESYSARRRFIDAG